jgi:gamma-glutamyltranspeptidase/glutathione hydrolase
MHSMAAPAVAFAPWRPYESRVHARPADRRSAPDVRALVAVALVVRLALALPAAAAEPARADAEPVAGRHGAIAAEHPRAAEIGAEMLARGGNAVDAAIATAYAVCVLNASSCGVGGGGFMLIQEANGTVHALDYRETAPSFAHRNLFRNGNTVLSNLSRRGGLAVAVPGEVAGLEAAREKFAKLPRAVLMAPAIALARDGFPIGGHLASEITGNASGVAATPALARLLLHEDGSPKTAGETLRMPALAATLERVARLGVDGFYRGPVATAIARGTSAAGGILSTRDLARYRPIWRTPLHVRYRDLDVFAMPPPSSGGVILEILNVLGGDDLATLGPRSPAYLHLLAEAMKHGFADRARWYGDPAFTKVPVDRLTSAAYAHELRARIDPDHVQPPSRYGSEPDHGTTHLSVADADGMAVSCTTTINTAFGAMVVGADSGVILNNEMDDFAIAPGVPNTFGLIGGEANAVAPGKRPLSSMTPVIARSADHAAPDRRLLVVGGSGGPLIMSGTLQVLLDMADFGFDAAAAVAAPRIHDQWTPAVLALEAPFGDDVRKPLAVIGHDVRPLPFAGAMQAVRWQDGRFDAGADPRKGGGVAVR